MCWCCSDLHSPRVQVYTVQRQSIPNMAALLQTDSACGLPDCINFDSLKNKFAAMFDAMRHQAHGGCGAQREMGVTCFR